MKRAIKSLSPVNIFERFQEAFHNAFYKGLGG